MKPIDVDIDVLKLCPLFANVAESDIHTILSCLNSFAKSYPKDDFIFVAGEKPHEVGVVMRGSVTLFQEDYWGNKSLVEKISTGGLFAEAFVSAKAPIALHVVAASDTEILFIDYDRIMTLCSSACAFHQVLIKNIVSAIAFKNIALMRKLEHISKRSIQEKLLSYLSEQAIAHNSSQFTLPFSRQELADYLSIDRASLSRSLSLMKDRGLIDYQSNKFTLYDRLDR